MAGLASARDAGQRRPTGAPPAGVAAGGPDGTRDVLAAATASRATATARRPAASRWPGLDADHPETDAEVWEKAIRKLRAGLMPPAGAPRPTAPSWTAFRRIDRDVDRSRRGWRKPNPGATALHRLNRTEYGNAIRDLLALDVDASTLLPADDSTEGFDNIADVLGTSPALIERYIGAASKISRLAVGDTDHGTALDHLQGARRPLAGSPHRRAAASARAAAF